MRWTFALIGFFVALAFSVSAFLYMPPAVMEKEMGEAVERAPVMHMGITGEAEGGSLKVDLLSREAASMVRISYPPLKLINNQWIALGDANHPFIPSLERRGEHSISPPSGGGVRGGETLFNYLHLTRRLTTLRDLWARRERYAFAFDGELKKAFSGAVPEEGELTMDARTGLPMELRAAQLRASVIYNDPLENQAAHTRPLEDVMAQLREVAEAQNGRPKKITPLAQNRDDASAFSHDFDRDGLSDAVEIFYGTDVANPDTDNDTFLDGDEVERGFSPTGAGWLN